MHGNSLVKRTGLNSTYTTKYCNVATTVNLLNVDTQYWNMYFYMFVKVYRVSVTGNLANLDGKLLESKQR